MNVGLAGKSLRAMTIECSAVLHFSDDFTARIESPFTFRAAGKQYSFFLPAAIRKNHFGRWR